MDFKVEDRSKHDRCIVWGRIISLLICVHGAAQAQDSDQIARDDISIRQLERMLFERMSDPTFDGEVQFLTGIPLISPTPDAAVESQYLTSLVLRARQVVQSAYIAQISELIKATVKHEDDFKSMPQSVKDNTMGCVVGKILGISGTELIPGLPNQIVDRALRHSTGGQGADHPQGHSHNAPMQIGFSASHTDVTTGLHALLAVDKYMRAVTNRRAGILALLGTYGVNWEIFEREARQEDFCRRLIDRSITFVLHRESSNYLVCGYAVHKETLFWMAFDLSLIERRVSVNSSGGGMAYSEFRTNEDKLRDQNPQLDPLFWDYTSYFSSKNLPSFSLIPAKKSEIISAIYSSSLVQSEIVALIRSEVSRTIQERKVKTGDQNHEPSNEVR